MESVVITLNGTTYRVNSLVEAAGPHTNKEDSEFRSVRAEWLSPYSGWTKLRNVNILAELREIIDTNRNLTPKEQPHEKTD